MDRIAADRIAVLASGAGSTLAWLTDARERGTLRGRIVRVIIDREGTGAEKHARAAGIPHNLVSGKLHPAPEALSGAILDLLQGEADLIVCAGFLSILSEPLLGSFRGRIINTHPALLPRHGGMGLYGIHVHRAVLAAGERFSGATVHVVDSGVDTGKIISQVRVPVFPSDTPEQLALRVQGEEKPHLLRVINALLSEDTASGPEPIRGAVIGGGGREHALAWKLLRDPGCNSVLALPGNGGTASLRGCRNLSLPDEFPALRRLLEREGINLVIIGPEQPLVDGLADRLREAGFPVFGPGAFGARLEGSKVFAKEFMLRHGVATAAYRSFRKGEENAALDFARSLNHQVAVKADGLAAGKGVLLCHNRDETLGALDLCFSGTFGAAGEAVVVEELLQGPEASLFVIHDGIDYAILPAAADYKRAFDGDQGPNTGGMGSVAPAPHFTPRDREAFITTILNPTLRGLREEGIPWRGVLFFGLILTPAGPRLLEYNVRFGDPETQSLMLLLPDDFARLLYTCAAGLPEFARHAASFQPSGLTETGGAYSCSVVAVSGGYPDRYGTGEEIEIDTFPEDEGICFIAGARKEGDGLHTTGGRVLSAGALASSPEAAREGAYRIMEKVHFRGMRYRRDIGTLPGPGM